MASLKPCSLQVKVTSSRTLRSTVCRAERMEVVALRRARRRSMLCRRARHLRRRHRRFAGAVEVDGVGDEGTVPSFIVVDCHVGDHVECKFG